MRTLHKFFSTNKVKYSFLLIIFILIFFLLDFGLGSILRYKYFMHKPDMNKLMWTDFYNFNKNSIDILFIGSSHARFAFNTEDFDKVLDKNTFNFSSADQTPVIAYRVLQEALKLKSQS